MADYINSVNLNDTNYEIHDKNLDNLSNNSGAVIRNSNGTFTTQNLDDKYATNIALSKVREKIPSITIEDIGIPFITQINDTIIGANIDVNGNSLATFVEVNNKIDKNMAVAANSLEPGQAPTINYNSTTNKLTLGIPKGAEGERGATWFEGDDYPSGAKIGDLWLYSGNVSHPDGYRLGDVSRYTGSTWVIQGNIRGAKGADGHTPQKGVEYWTNADKQEIVNDVINTLPKYDGGTR